MKKMKLHTPNATQENIAHIRGLFPSCVTEVRGNNGQLELAIDFDLFRQELSESMVEGPQERYHLNWPGKRESLFTANAPIAKTLRPCPQESVDFDTTKNLFIEGDNLEALKLLQEAYLGKVKMIYIDPPYNTGNDFVYKDDFAESTDAFLKKSCQMDAEGNRLVANTESNGRFHSDWLSMMYPRLKLAKNLLSDAGLIFISIDSHEVENLAKLCAEIFGEDNFVSKLIWKNGRTASSHFTNEHEYILCYARSKENVPLFKYNGKENLSDRAIKRPTIKNSISSIRFPAGIDFECEDRIFPNEFGEGEPVKVVEGIFEAKNRKLAHDVVLEAAWTMKDMIEGWIQGQEIYDQKGQRVVRFFFKANGVLQYEKQKGTIHPKSIIEAWSTKQGGNDIINLFGRNCFDFPKPVGLISFLIGVISEDTDIILDFFAGSSTTAHAVMQLNAEDGGNRKFIMVQLPERCEEKSEAYKAGFSTIAEISKERIRRAGKKILEGDCHNDWNKDVGFRVFKIDSSNMVEVYYTPDSISQRQLDLFAENIKPDRTPEDLLFQVLLDWGVDLSLSVHKKTIQGKSVFFVDDSALIACFDKEVPEKLVKDLAKFNPMRVVFRDDGFMCDAVKINVEQIFKQMSSRTEVKSV